MGRELEQARTFSRQLVDAYRGQAVSIALYGSAARGEYREGLSDLNVLVLLDRTDPATLRLGTAPSRRWVESGNPPPLLLSLEEWRRSADVFPIEYADIRDAHLVLHGSDPFAGVEIDAGLLRLQLERELKGKQIQLRERYLLSAGEPEELGSLLARSLSTFLVLFRALLRLTGEAVPRAPEEVIRRTAMLASFDAEPLQAIERAREGAGVLRPGPDDLEVVGYLEAVARVVEHVDRLAADSAPRA